MGDRQSGTSKILINFQRNFRLYTMEKIQCKKKKEKKKVQFKNNFVDFYFIKNIH